MGPLTDGEYTEYSGYCMEYLVVQGDESNKEANRCYAGFVTGTDGVVWGAASSDLPAFEEFADPWKAIFAEPSMRDVLQSDDTMKQEWVDETQVIAGIALSGSDKVAQDKTNYPGGVWMGGSKYKHLQALPNKVGEHEITVYMLAADAGKVAAVAVMPVEVEGGCVVIGMADKSKNQDAGNMLNQVIRCCKFMVGE